MNETVYKVTISDKLILEHLSKLSFFVYKDKSRIDGYPFYEINLFLFCRYIKIKKIKGEDVSIYDTVLENMIFVSSIEDHIPGFLVRNPTRTIILTPNII